MPPQNPNPKSTVLITTLPFFCYKNTVPPCQSKVASASHWDFLHSDELPSLTPSTFRNSCNIQQAVYSTTCFGSKDCELLDLLQASQLLLLHPKLSTWACTILWNHPLQPYGIRGVSYHIPRFSSHNNLWLIQTTFEDVSRRNDQKLPTYRLRDLACSLAHWLLIRSRLAFFLAAATAAAANMSSLEVWAHNKDLPLGCVTGVSGS